MFQVEKQLPDGSWQLCGYVKDPDEWVRLMQRPVSSPSGGTSYRITAGTTTVLELKIEEKE